MGLSARLEASLLDQAAVAVQPDDGTGGPQRGPAAPVRSGGDRMRAAGAVGKREFLDPPVRADAPDLACPDLGEPHNLTARVDADRGRVRRRQRVRGDEAVRGDPGDGAGLVERAPQRAVGAGRDQRGHAARRQRELRGPAVQADPADPVRGQQGVPQRPVRPGAQPVRRRGRRGHRHRGDGSGRVDPADPPVAPAEPDRAVGTAGQYHRTALPGAQAHPADLPVRTDAGELAALDQAGPCGAVGGHNDAIRARSDVVFGDEHCPAS